MSTSCIVLIADATESAAPFWSQTAKTIADLINTLQAEVLGGVYLLGTRVCLDPVDWHTNMTIPSEAKGSGSFLAPVMSALRMRRIKPQTIIIVGAGEIFDLVDWVSNGMRWVLVLSNQESLQGPDGRLLEITHEAIGTLTEILTAFPKIILPSTESGLEGVVNQLWDLDGAGFPLVYVPPIRAYVHLFPVTKLQFEHFLAEARLSGYGDSWYIELLKLNPRLSPTASNCSDYEQLLVTGLLPDEVNAYLRWHGRGFKLLTVEQWRETFQWLEKQSFSVLPAELDVDLAPLARRLWEDLLVERCPNNLLDFSLMRGGVIEWVRESAGASLGMGQPRESFRPGFHDALRDAPFTPPSLVRRSKFFGFRLMRNA